MGVLGSLRICLVERGGGEKVVMDKHFIQGGVATP